MAEPTRPDLTCVHARIACTPNPPGFGTATRSSSIESSISVARPARSPGVKFQVDTTGRISLQIMGATVGTQATSLGLPSFETVSVSWAGSSQMGFPLASGFFPEAGATLENATSRKINVSSLGLMGARRSLIGSVRRGCLPCLQREQELELRGREGIAAGRVAAFEAIAEPAHALFRRAMREGVGHDGAA